MEKGEKFLYSLALCILSRNIEERIGDGVNFKTNSKRG